MRNFFPISNNNNNDKKHEYVDWSHMHIWSYEMREIVHGYCVYQAIKLNDLFVAFIC